jgi:hypothetical protein
MIMCDPVQTAVSVACRQYTAFALLDIKVWMFGMMLAIVGIASHNTAFAANISNTNNANRAAIMDKQRALNQANLSKKRHFDKKEQKGHGLKLDAIPPSPRHRADPDLKSLPSMKGGAAKETKSSLR